MTKTTKQKAIVTHHTHLNGVFHAAVLEKRVVYTRPDGSNWITHCGGYRMVEVDPDMPGQFRTNWNVQPLVVKPAQQVIEELINGLTPNNP